MAEAPVEKSNSMKYVLPIVGATVPAALITLMRRRAGRAQETKEEMLLKESSINLQGALNKALKYMPGTPVEVELEEEHGMAVWEVEIVPKSGGPTRQVVVDARSGDVLEMTAEYPEEESK